MRRRRSLKSLIPTNQTLSQNQTPSLVQVQVRVVRRVPIVMTVMTILVQQSVMWISTLNHRDWNGSSKKRWMTSPDSWPSKAKQQLIVNYNNPWIIIIQTQYHRRWNMQVLSAKLKPISRNKSNCLKCWTTANLVQIIVIVFQWENSSKENNNPR